MNVQIFSSCAAGEVAAPPSKSMAHRALLCAALSEGSTVCGLAYSQDILATIQCLRALGAAVEQNGDTVRLGDLRPFDTPDDVCLDCNESGSTLRFLLPLCMLSGRVVTLTGSQRLFERPLSVYESIAREQGGLFEKVGNRLRVCGGLRAGTYRVPGNISSQFITGLLYALPLLPGDSCLEIIGGLESGSYVDLTLAALKEFGISIHRDGSVFHIPGEQKFDCCAYTVEGDCSNAAFLDALNVVGGAVRVTGLAKDTLQGDRVYRTMYESLLGGGRRFDLTDCPDLGPIMFALAAATGGAEFTGTARLSIKESDRCAAMAMELAKYGITMQVGQNTVSVQEGTLQTPAVPLCGHNDHRIVMALAVLCTITGGIIEGAEAVRKSFPDFFDVLKSLQIGLTEL